MRADLAAPSRAAALELAVFFAGEVDGPKDGEMRVVNTHGWVATLSGTPLPPDSPARMSW
jgi:hypothetical protein